MFGVGDLDAWLKLVHIVAVIFWVGGSLLVQVFAARMTRADAARRIGLGEDMLLIGRLFAVAGVIVLAAGAWLVFRIDAWDWDQAWISIGFVGVAVGAVLGPAFHTPQITALIAETKAGDPTAAARNRRLGTVSSLEAAILLVVVWAMVFKPGL